MFLKKKKICCVNKKESQGACRGDAAENRGMREWERKRQERREIKEKRRKGKKKRVSVREKESDKKEGKQPDGERE